MFTMLKEWFCPKCSLPTIDVAFLVRKWPEVGLKIFLLGSILLFAFSVLAFLVREAMRNLSVDRSFKSSADRDSVLVERYVKDIDTAVEEIIRLADFVKKTNRKFAGDWMNTDKAMGKSAELVDYLSNRNYDAKKENKIGTHWMNKDKVKNNNLLGLESRNPQAKHGPSVKILLGPNNMRGETESAKSMLSVSNSSRAYLTIGLGQDMKEYLKNESVESPRSDTILGSQNLNMDKISKKRSRDSCNKVVVGRSEPKRQQIRRSLRSKEKPAKDIVLNNNTCTVEGVSNGLHSEVRPMTIQCFPMRSKYEPSQELDQKNKIMRCEVDVSEKHNQDKGCQRSRNFLLKATSCSELTIRNKSRSERIFKRDSESSSGTPKVKIEFNVRKHSSLKHKPPTRSYTQCRKRTRGHQIKRKHATLCGYYGARSLRK